MKDFARKGLINETAHFKINKVLLVFTQSYDIRLIIDLMFVPS